MIPDGMTGIQLANNMNKAKYRMKKVSMMEDAIIGAEVKSKLLGLD